ncbi:MAG: hypothetical protein Q9186_006888 [Xanthomendoza sp. 1 TL-2023]
MARKLQCQPSIVSVIHHDVGQDRSISIELFLRSLKRVPSKSFSQLRAPMRQGLSPSVESQPDKVTTSSGAPLLFADEIPKVQPSCEQNCDIVIPSQVSGDLEHAAAQPRFDEGYTVECSLADIPDCQSQGDLSRDLDQITCPSEGRLPKAIVTYSKHNKRSRRPPIIDEPPPREPGESPRRRVPVNELVLVDNTEESVIPRISKPDKSNQQQTPARKPLHDTRHNIRLSKGTSIDPTEFKFPPRTPSAVKPVTWRLGSGFKRLRKRAEEKKKKKKKKKKKTMISPLQDTRGWDNLDKSVRQNPVMSNNNASSIPRIDALGQLVIAPSFEDTDEEARYPEPSTIMVSTNALRA